MTAQDRRERCACDLRDRAAVRASPYHACPLCGCEVDAARRYAETMRRPHELLAGGRLARVSRTYRFRR